MPKVDATEKRDIGRLLKERVSVSELKPTQRIINFRWRPIEKKPGKARLDDRFSVTYDLVDIHTICHGGWEKTGLFSVKQYYLVRCPNNVLTLHEVGSGDPQKHKCMWYTSRKIFDELIDKVPMNRMLYDVYRNSKR